MSTETTQFPEEQNDTGKVDKKFNEALTKVVDILGSKDLMHRKKSVPGDIVSEIVVELTKEREEKLRGEVKTELQSMLTKYIEFEDEVKKKEDELKSLKEKKKKEFIEASNKFFSKIENSDAFAKRMRSALETATASSDATSSTPVE